MGASFNAARFRRGDQFPGLEPGLYGSASDRFGVVDLTIEPLLVSRKSVPEEGDLSRSGLVQIDGVNETVMYA